MQTDWRPTAGMEVLRFRARVLGEIRRFFAERGVLEVDTPILSEAGATDPHTESFRTRHPHPDSGVNQPYFLHTSPELAMKRMIAAGSGPIYQVCKVFRKAEIGRRHNPEFTLVEWYRPDFTHHDLMDEVDDLIRRLAGSNFAERLKYGDAFINYVKLDPHMATAEQLRTAAEPLLAKGLKRAPRERSTLLELLFSHFVVRRIGLERPTLLYDYPSCQAALARIDGADPPVAERFELFMAGMEIGSGYHELTDPVEQRIRFELENQRREALGRNRIPIDQRFLSALENGMTRCAGVALGLERLLMALGNVRNIRDVMAFPFDRA
jgi:lysyl-tRNA synthetase class 2